MPQLSVTRPHLPLQVIDLTALVQPQTLGVPPPPQVFGAMHWVVPQSTMTLQRSTTRPHLPRQVIVLSLTQPTSALASIPASALAVPPVAPLPPRPPAA